MSKPAPNLGLTAIAEHFLTRLRAWWLHRNELGSIDPNELERIAGEIGMTGRNLQQLAARGPDAADLLLERMHTLGITRDDVERVSRGLMRDLEKTCTCCNEKGGCSRDLATRPNADAWKDYCPNAISLDSVKKIKGRFA
jgi:hypothetical protein